MLSQGVGTIRGSSQRHVLVYVMAQFGDMIYTKSAGWLSCQLWQRLVGGIVVNPNSAKGALNLSRDVGRENQITA